MCWYHCFRNIAVSHAHGEIESSPPCCVRVWRAFQFYDQGRHQRTYTFGCCCVLSNCIMTPRGLVNYLSIVLWRTPKRLSLRPRFGQFRTRMSISLQYRRRPLSREGFWLIYPVKTDSTPDDSLSSNNENVHVTILYNP